MPHSSVIYLETFLIALAVAARVSARLEISHVPPPALSISHSLSAINLPLQTIFSYAVPQGILYMLNIFSVILNFVGVVKHPRLSSNILKDNSKLQPTRCNVS